MSENPKCPYCGEEMKLSSGRAYPIIGRHWYRCDNCNAFAPEANSPEEAYAAATKRDRAKGEWVNVRFSADGSSSADCNRCGVTVHTSFSNSVNFCPNCGADMREVANDER